MAILLIINTGHRYWPLRVITPSAIMLMMHHLIDITSLYVVIIIDFRYASR